MSNHHFVLDWNPQNGSYRLWNFDPQNSDPLPGPPKQSGTWSSVKEGHELIPIGNYVLDWVPATGGYRLWNLDAQSSDPLPGPAVQQGTWQHIRTGHKLVSLGNYVLDWEPATGGYRLWNFDPQSSNPLPKAVQSGTWSSVKEGHELIPIGNYVLDWVPATGSYRLWIFDPQSSDPLPGPAIQSGTWNNIGSGHKLVPVGENYILDWEPSASDSNYRLWSFDPSQTNPLPQIVQQDSWQTLNQPQVLVGVQPLITVTQNPSPGTIDFMRSKIQRVVFYMLENRSFDHVCGWLYENDTPSHFIGGGHHSFDGTSFAHFNVDNRNQNIYVSKVAQGNWTCPTVGAKHDHPDVMHQLFDNGSHSYSSKQDPTMTGFVTDNDTGQAMETYTPKQLPILNGLAKAYSVSDKWFCSLPGPTDVNRAFSLTGSSFGRTVNFESGSTYANWPDSPHRPSIWKILWSNGFQDWKIYYPHAWYGFCYTEQLFLKKQIPTVDHNRSQYVQSLDQFFTDASNGQLPKFSYIEPSWLGGGGARHTPDSYHPSQDLVPGEQTLNRIYQAILDSPQRDETLLIISFDEHGGQYDHVPPPYGVKPYPHDISDGFKFDLYGVRVPTIMVSPWINEKTVFRAEGGTPYDATSILATLLKWHGIPKSRWGVGNRTNIAPTFENIFQRTTVRTDHPTFTPPQHESQPELSEITVSDLHQTFIPRVIWHLGYGKRSNEELQKVSDDIIHKATTIAEVHAEIKAFEEEIKTS